MKYQKLLYGLFLAITSQLQATQGILTDYATVQMQFSRSKLPTGTTGSDIQTSADGLFRATGKR